MKLLELLLFAGFGGGSSTSFLGFLTCSSGSLSSESFLSFSCCGKIISTGKCKISVPKRGLISLISFYVRDLFFYVSLEVDTFAFVAS